MKGAYTTIIGCGILQKEVRYLSRINRWDLDGIFLDATLHNNLARLAGTLKKALAECSAHKKFVLYGTCHPRMDQILTAAGTFRTEGQNCIEMLLGPEIFSDELKKGAFFLLEEWARHWDRVLTTAYHHCRPEVIKEIFKSDRAYFLGLRTPCSGDFARLAGEIAGQMDVPLQWLDVTLDHLEQVLNQALRRIGRFVDG